MTAALQRSELGVTARKAVALARPLARQTLRERFAKGSVEWSPDLQRIMALPRRTKPELEAIALALTQVLKKPSGTQTLRELQAWALTEGPQAGGLLALAATGAGKTLLGMLMPMVWKWIEQADGTIRPPRCVLFIPPDLRVQFAADWIRYGQHWNLPNLAGGDTFEVGKPILHVIAYSELQQPKNSALLEQLQPDLVMGDEISALRNFEAARTRRLLRYFGMRPETTFCGWDATITAQSLQDYCLAPETRILTSDLTWVRAGDVKVGQELVGFGERLGREKMRPTLVEGVARLQQPRLKLTTTKGSIVCSTLHQWVLCRRNGKRPYLKGRSGFRGWVTASEIQVGDELAFYVDPWDFDGSREGGYLAGLLDGEGWVSVGRVGFGQKAGGVLERYVKGLSDRSFEFTLDAHKSSVFRVSTCGQASSVRLLGMLRPPRLMLKSNTTWAGKVPYGKSTQRAKVLEIENLGVGEVVAIQTTEKTLIAEGFLTHNSHFLGLALAENSPVPIEEVEVRRWARALDPERYDDGYYLPGELMKFCLPGETVRQGFQRRLLQTLGVVASEKNLLAIPLFLKERKPPPMPVQILECLKLLRRPPAQQGWRRPDGEVFVEAAEVVACARQLAAGFFMRWRYPKGEPVELIDEWFEKRQAWNRELRAQLQSPQVHLDSKKLCENAAARWFDGGCPGCHRKPLEDHAPICRVVETHPLWPSYTYLAWREIEDKVYHETETVWLSEWLLQDAAAWAREAPGIVWVDHPEFGERLARLTGLTYYGGGERSAEELEAKFGEGNGVSKTSIICSVKANMKGKNLQFAFSRNLIVSMPASNAVIEQVIGRTYREYQVADRVTVDYYLHTSELENALEKAIERAKYVQETFGSDQKLVFGKWEKAA